MAMDRLVRVARLWNWLPAFRVVAEYESIQKAAVVLAVSPSALSRTVKLLEEAVGELLFVRSTSGLALTAAGGELLKGTRDAMRQLDDSLTNTAIGPARARMFVAGAGGPVLPRLLSHAFGHAMRQTPGDMRYGLREVGDEALFEDLFRGDLDLGLIDAHSVSHIPEGLSREAVGHLVFALHEAEESTQDLEPIASKNPSGVIALSMAHAGNPERVLATVASLEAAEILARAVRCRAMLPVALAAPTFRAVEPLAFELPVVVVTRTPIGAIRSEVVDALVASLRALLVSSPSA